jgi:hypothetical protein
MRSTLLDIDTRLRVARAIEKDETQASIAVFQMLKGRGHPNGPPPTISDGWGGIDQAMIEVYGVVPQYCGRFAGTKLKAIFGSKEELIALLGKSTAYIERSNLTSRLFNGRQTRKTLAFSKDVDCYRAAATWEDAYYNLVKPHKSLRLRVYDLPGRKWQERTPAMAAQLTDHVCTVKELLTLIPIRY